MTRKQYITCLLLSGFGIMILGAFSFIPNCWMSDLLSQFRLIYPVILLILLALSAVARARIAAATLAVCLLVTSFPVARMYAHSHCGLPDDRQTIRILNFNTECQSNRRYDLLSSLIENSKPDFIALVEVDNKWIEAIDSATQPYPYRKVILEGPGMAVFSKYPMEVTDVKSCEHHPRIFLTLKINRQDLHLLIAHPPKPSSTLRFEQRNREFVQMSDEIRTIPAPKVLIGDMNCGPWSPAFNILLKSGLRDSEQGFGPQPSCPARTGRVFPRVSIPPLIPIDHVLISDDLCVQRRFTGPSTNSDHLPVIVDLVLRGQKSEE